MAGMYPVFGIEVECIAIDGIPRGDYHAGLLIDGGKWLSEVDGSLNNRLSKYNIYEFVSTGLLRAEDVLPRLNSLRNYIVNQAKSDCVTGVSQCIEPIVNGIIPLDVIKFNTSTGAHIHFSLAGSSDSKKPDMLFKHFDHRLQGLVRSKYFESIERLLPYWEYKKHYMRDMAKPMEEDPNKHFMSDGSNSLFDSGSKYREFHSTEGKGMEWRAVHNVGLKTWNDVLTNYSCAIKALNDVLLNELKMDKPFLQSFKIYQ